MATSKLETYVKVIDVAQNVAQVINKEERVQALASMRLVG